MSSSPFPPRQIWSSYKEQSVLRTSVALIPRIKYRVFAALYSETKKTRATTIFFILEERVMESVALSSGRIQDVCGPGFVEVDISNKRKAMSYDYHPNLDYQYCYFRYSPFAEYEAISRIPVPAVDCLPKKQKIDSRKSEEDPFQDNALNQKKGGE
jgi:hypothetical protein